MGGKRDIGLGPGVTEKSLPSFGLSLSPSRSSPWPPVLQSLPSCPTLSQIGPSPLFRSPPWLPSAPGEDPSPSA